MNSYEFNKRYVSQYYPKKDIKCVRFIHPVNEDSYNYLLNKADEFNYNVKEVKEKAYDASTCFIFDITDGIEITSVYAYPDRLHFNPHQHIRFIDYDLYYIEDDIYRYSSDDFERKFASNYDKDIIRYLDIVDEKVHKQFMMYIYHLGYTFDLDNPSFRLEYDSTSFVRE